MDRSLRHAAAIDGIVHLVVHGDDVLIAAAINTRGRPWFGWPSVVLDRIHVFFLLISLLGPDLKFEGPRKGLT